MSSVDSLGNHLFLPCLVIMQDNYSHLTKEHKASWDPSKMKIEVTQEASPLDQQRCYQRWKGCATGGRRNKWWILFVNLEPIAAGNMSASINSCFISIFFKNCDRLQPWRISDRINWMRSLSISEWCKRWTVADTAWNLY